MRTFKPYIKKYWKLFFLGLFFLTLEAGADLMQPMLMSRIINEGVLENNLDVTIQIGLTMLVVTAFGALAACTRNVLASYVSQNFGAALRQDLYQKIHRLTFTSIDKQNRASLITRLTNDVTQVQNFLNGTMRIFVKAPLICIGAIIMAINLNVQLSATFMVLIPIVFLIIFTVMRQTFPLFSKMQLALDGVNNRMREYLSGVRVVKAFNRYDYENSQFQDASGELADVSTNALKWSSLMGPGIALTLNLGIVFILWAGGQLVTTGATGVGEVIAFTTYTTQIAVALGMMSWVFTMFVRAKASAIRISEVFDEAEVESEMNNLEIQPKIKGAIAFENVNFSFGEGKENLTLQNISFDMMPGERLGIIGATGSGKTTLINLLMKFYQPDSGAIYMDGVDIRNITDATLREEIAVVPQRAVLFSGTILSNLQWGKAIASLEEIKEATQIASIDDFILSLEQGYESKIEQGGLNFSGGQRQRLAIARALIRKPAILILDDSLSAVDAHTEEKIKDGLANYPHPITQIVIAQKIASVATYDKILVIDKGQVVGIGTHEELLATSTIYQEIYESQIGKGGVKDGAK